MAGRIKLRPDSSKSGNLEPTPVPNIFEELGLDPDLICKIVAGINALWEECPIDARAISGLLNCVTLDEAYDCGGDGMGRIICADAGPVEILCGGGLVVDGSTTFGDDASDIHTFTGQVIVDGDVTVNGETTTDTLVVGYCNPPPYGGTTKGLTVDCDGNIVTDGTLTICTDILFDCDPAGLNIDIPGGTLLINGVPISTFSNKKVVEYLDYLDTINMVIKLNQVPNDVTVVEITPEAGPDQFYIDNYTVRKVVGGTVPGYYICVDPVSTAPGGGAFDGGSNPLSGMLPLLGAGDEVKASYEVD